MSTETITKPKLDDPLGEWPPLGHLIRKEDQPAKEGDTALCGAKLMGINLNSANKLCPKCVEIARNQS